MERVGRWALIIGKIFSETERFDRDLEGLGDGALVDFRNKNVPYGGGKVRKMT
jgi:hypothetical protein